PITDSLRAGDASFDRVAATTRLSNAGADPDTLQHSEGVAVSQLGQLIARTRKMAPLDEAEAFRARRLWMQPNLANTLSVGTFAMSGADADQFLTSLDERADQIIDPQDPHRPCLEQRRVDALISLALDATTATTLEPAKVAPRRLKGNIFIDATQAATNGGETGATTRSGVKVGPNTLEEILCIGETQTTLLDIDGLKAVLTNGDRLPNRTRDYIFYRDGACTADGCTSRYRLEPHHIQPRSHHGDHQPDNLTLLCWFHHHVVVHQQGFRIDANSPPHRRRFIPTSATRAPPDQ
ncbi:MAG: HNH endonuclease, partial [bacterium]|nr:HNH endonuclease [bacterium]